MNKVQEVACHPQYSRLVKEIAYDATNAARNLPNDSFSFTQDDYIMMMCAHFPNLSQAAARRGYAEHKERRNEERLLVANSFEDFTKLPLRRLPKTLRVLLEHHDNHQQLLPYLADDLAIWCLACERWPN